VSPIRDPGSRAARRLTRLAARLLDPDRSDEESAKKSSPRRRPARARAPEDRPKLDHSEPQDEEWEELPKREKHGRRGPGARRRPAATPPESAPIPSEDGSLQAEVTGLVVATTRGPCEIELTDGARVTAHLPKALARADRSTVTVGDRVRVVRRASGELVVSSVLPRTSRLSRPDPFHAHRERVLVANLELAIVVTSIRNPPIATGLIDRFLVALRHGGVDAAIAVNKIDLADDRAVDDELETLRVYTDIGVPVALCSAKTGLGLKRLRSWISGRVVALVGHSGVGKSSLLNALAPNEAAPVGEVARKAQRGRHTTSNARVYRLEDSTRIVDTPGIREFGLWNLTAGELAAYFDEFAPFAERCRFANCSHQHEPKCAVRHAAESGVLSNERFATYLRILASLERE
jgi:ribosome biogenesis GTPase